MKTIGLFILTIFSLLSISCNTQKQQTVQEGEPLITTASLLDIRDLKGSFLVTIKNPWDTTAVLQRYFLVPRGESNGSWPGATTVEIPLSKSVVYSGVYGQVMAELGVANAIAGVADASFFTMPIVKEGLAKGKIIDIGASTNPNVESVVALSPDAIITSPYKNAGEGPLERLGKPMIQMADYMEPTPLARAEWIKLIGLLYGKYAEADSIYRSVTHNYNTVKGIAANMPNHPKVITEQLIGGVWALPGGKSYKAQMLADAGGDYPWKDDNSSGSLQLDFSSVFAKASNADFWFITSYGAPLTRQTLRADYQANDQFKAWKEGNIYTCDTSIVPLFDEFPFHPDRLLSDYVSILYGEKATGLTPKYFHRAD